jgi:hypothetical protein
MLLNFKTTVCELKFTQMPNTVLLTTLRDRRIAHKMQKMHSRLHAPG